MNENVSVALTTTELASALVLCGYDAMANQIITSMNLMKSEDKFENFVKETEINLKVKGYWDESRKTSLKKELEDLLHLLVYSKQKVRCIKGAKVLFIHLVNEKNVLIQKILNNVHTFTFQSNEEGYQTAIIDFLQVNQRESKQPSNFPSLLLSAELFDQFHQMDQDTMSALMSDPQIEEELRTFIRDFQQNDQEFDNISFMKMDFTNDYMDMLEIDFLLVSKQFIWHVDYEHIDKDEIYIVPINHQKYCEKVSKAIEQYFLGNPKASSFK